jgi:hypothetical protein
MFRVKPDGVCCCRSTLAISGRTKQTRLAFFLSSKLLLVLPVFGSEPIPDLNRTRTEPQYEFGGHRKTGPDRGSCSAREPLRESAITCSGVFTPPLEAACGRLHAALVCGAGSRSCETFPARAGAPLPPSLPRWRLFSSSLPFVSVPFTHISPAYNHTTLAGSDRSTPSRAPWATQRAAHSRLHSRHRLVHLAV